MNLKKTILAALVAGLGLVFVSTGQDDFDPAGLNADRDLPKIVRVQVEFIEVPQATMTDLLYGPRKSADDTKLRGQLQEMIKAGKASMLETQMAVARPGQKTTTEAIHEFIYPTEYEPPLFPDDKEGSGGAAFPVTPVGPTAFETRNVGSTLEIEPNIGENDEVVELRFNPELIYYTGNQIWNERKDGENVTKISMPNFYTIRVTAGVTTITGQYSLAASVSPKDDKGEPDFSRKVLIFVKADVLTVGR